MEAQVPTLECGTLGCSRVFVMLSVVLLRVIMLSVVLLRVIMLNVFMQSVAMLKVNEAQVWKYKTSMKNCGQYYKHFTIVIYDCYL